ncbi:MAG: ABC transporter substrate-binding protein [Solirubrobacteraceae bacterium]
MFDRPSPRPRARHPRNLRVLVGAAIASLVLAACGSSETSGTAGDASPDGAATRTVATAMGPVEISGTPKRVVVLDTPELDLATTLGVTPVGTVKASVGDGLPRYLAEQAEGIANVGTIEEPDLVAIAKLRPDLILGSKVRIEKLYPQLTKIAPTVFTETPADWKANVRTNARALGRATQADSFLQRYAARARAVGERLGDAAATTVGVVRFLPGEIRLYSPRSFVGSVLKDVGVTLPDAAEKATDINATLSLENLHRADADVLYTTVYGPAKDTDEAKAKRLPAWKRLQAVRAGRVHPEPDDVWMLGIGVTGADRVLDELERTLPAS